MTTPVHYVIKKPICDGIGNVMKSFITAYSVNEYTTIDCNRDFVFGNYDTVLDPRHIYVYNDADTVEFMYTSRLLVLKDEEDEQQHIFSEENAEVNGCGNNNCNHHYSFRRLIDYNYRPELLCDKLKERIWRTIDNITFHPTILNALGGNGKHLTSNSLAISVRTWTSFHETNIHRPYSVETYKEMISRVLTSYPEIDKIVLSLDNDSVKQEYIDLISKMTSVPIFVLSQSDDINPLQFAIIKMLTLSKCKYFIGNRISTFSELVFWFSKCNIQCFPLF
jgi:hypothetical protein